MIRMCCSYQSTISAEDNWLTMCVCLKFWNGALHSRTSHCKRNWPISLWMSLCCSTPFRVFSKQKRREAYSGLVTNMSMLSTLKTVHEYKYNLADSVNIAYSNALLSYGKKGRDVDTFDELRYTMVMTTDKSATVLPQPKMPSKSMSFMPNVIL